MYKKLRNLRVTWYVVLVLGLGILVTVLVRRPDVQNVEIVYAPTAIE